ncbi:MAG: hypothetical protein KDA84_17530 [Planctomycetaceae bacterium]|nr:hypothetical protein [Planctomycetaceae bacterium]
MEVIAAQIPSTIPQVEALSAWEFDEQDFDQEFQIMLRLKLPDGSPHFDFCQLLFVKKSRARTSFGIEDIPIRKEGILEFELLLNGNHIASHKVVVLRREDSEGDEKIVKRIDETGESH